jgi:hypothetical protein
MNYHTQLHGVSGGSPLNEGYFHDLEKEKAYPSSIVFHILQTTFFLEWEICCQRTFSYKLFCEFEFDSLLRCANFKNKQVAVSHVM